MANLFKRRGESIGVSSQSKVETTAVQAPKSKRVKTQHQQLITNDDYDQSALYDIRMTRQEQLLYEYQKTAEEAQISEYLDVYKCFDFSGKSSDL